MVLVGSRNLVRTLKLINTFKLNQNMNSSQMRVYHHKDSEENVSVDTQKTKISDAEVTLPPEPTHCCMTGCANCVWIKYAQELARLFDNGDVIAKNKISEKVHDPQLRAFLLTQLGLNDNPTKN